MASLTGCGKMVRDLQSAGGKPDNTLLKAITGPSLCDAVLSRPGRHR
jgi:hypothetical protein